MVAIPNMARPKSAAHITGIWRERPSTKVPASRPTTKRGTAAANRAADESVAASAGRDATWVISQTTTVL